jgi:hypothetical protein
MNPASPHSEIADKVLERIAEEHVTPRPRWQFTASNVTYWTLWAACTLLGAAVVAAVVFETANAGWEFRGVTHRDLFAFLFQALPMLWLILLALVLFAAFENMRHTQTGYRYPMIFVIGLSVMGSVAVGIALYAVGIGQQIDEEIGRHIPLNKPVLERQRVMWMNPTRGMLAGQVILVNDLPDQQADTFLLRTFDGQDHLVSLERVGPSGRAVLQQFPLVRVVGPPMATSSGAGPFNACFVFPWVLRGGWHVRVPPGSERVLTGGPVDDDVLVHCDGLPTGETIHLKTFQRAIAP